MYLLHFGRVRHQKVVDTVEILSIEKADFDLTPTVSSLKDFDLCTECPSQLRLSGFDIWVYCVRRGASCRFLFARFLNKLFRRAHRQSTIDNLPRDPSLEINLLQREKCSSVSRREASFLHKLLNVIRQAKQT